jgi:hypothetical protein
MKSLSILFLAILVVGGLAFALDENAATKDPSGLKLITGTIEKIDQKEQTLTLNVEPMTSEMEKESKEKTGSTSASEHESSMEKVFKFNERTTVTPSASQEEIPRLEDLKKGDKVTLHVDDKDVIHEIETANVDEKEK